MITLPPLRTVISPTQDLVSPGTDSGRLMASERTVPVKGPVLELTLVTRAGGLVIGVVPCTHHEVEVGRALLRERDRQASKLYCGTETGAI